ncbi:glycerophosphodiester phosphodiesterase [Streptomyces colonosanans]|uniref:Glycerophosphodiester phosphodiesterase n=1 Tax=Streptomyces colonosanans TaxID=1428652 RepID=A0A1S2P6C4_9ACTN|nr:glycerophosphodiester phosphodiesterase family protein [Streptomyces colonosanans]OIJ89106.1 glycerophosphodiester phosphodiesterase [Streptomyces colonosanans]
MHARAAAVAAIAVFGLSVVILPTPHAGATGGDALVVVAHRGASAYAPENTLAAIDRAAAMGFGWVENDVQRTKDGRLVVIHDDTLDRTTDAKRLFPHRAPWRVKDFTAAEIARLDAGSWFGTRYAGTHIPTLRQYMERVSHNHQKLVLEIKAPELYPGIEREILKLLADEGWLDPEHLKNRLIVQSFSADSVRTVHDLRPGIRTAFLGTPRVTQLPAYARFADQINSGETKLSAGYVSAVHAVKGPHDKPLKVFTWTVNSANDARRVAGFGVDGIITNAPDVVRRAVSSS